MSEQNVEIVRRTIEAFQHDDEEVMLSTVDPGIEWYPIEEGHSLSRGHEAAIRVRRSWLENWEGHQMDVEEMKDGADSVVACLHLTGRGKMSGVEVDLRVYMHYKLRDGKIVYVYEYAERGEALEAAGLSEQAMSEENVEIVRRGFAATLEGDWPTALATLDTEVEVRDFDIPDAGIYRGHEGFREWLSNWGESWEEWRLEDIEFRPAVDDQVIALFTMVTKGKGSGIEVRRGDAIVYRLDRDKITRTEYFNDQGKALEAAGLSE